MDEDQLSNKEVVGHEDVEFGSAGLVHTFAKVEEPSVQFLACVARFDVVSNVIGLKFSDLGVDFVTAEVPILDVARQHAGVSVVGVRGCALGGGGPADDHLGFDVLHRGEFQVEVWAAVKQHLWFGDKVAVVRVILPLVTVLVTAPFVGRGHVVLHWPHGRSVVVEVVVQVEQTWVDGGVRVVHGHAFEGQVAGSVTVPHFDDDAVLDEDGAVVVDGAGIVHRDHASGQHVGARMDVVQGGVAP